MSETLSHAATVQAWKMAGALAGMGDLPATVNPWLATAAAWATHSEALAWARMDDGNPGHTAAACWPHRGECRYCGSREWRAECPERRLARRQAWSGARLRALVPPVWMDGALEALGQALDVVADALDLARPSITWDRHWEPGAVLETGAFSLWLRWDAASGTLRALAGSPADDAPEWQRLRLASAVHALHSRCAVQVD